MTQTTIGIDISKDRLDAHRLPEGTAKRFSNDKKGCRALIAWIGRDPVARVVYEATGAYHRLLESVLGQAGLPLARVNPRQARRFAEAIGVLAKTDRVDAAMLARMGIALQPPQTPPASQRLADLRDLNLARRALVKDRTAARNRQKIARLPLIKRQLALRLRQIDRQIQTLDAAIDQLVQTDPDLRRRFEILISLPGISSTTATTLLAEMPELGTLQARQAASLAGLAPVVRQSGTWRGKAHIRGGRATLRQALYMPALVAARFNPDLKTLYKRLLSAGKPPKLAITAVMRKLITTANALLRENRKWTKQRA
ncbi:MAG: transposase [Kiloniellales bacterium]|nr:transposase [Kiloniellales bacterium]